MQQINDTETTKAQFTDQRQVNIIHIIYYESGLRLSTQYTI